MLAGSTTLNTEMTLLNFNLIECNTRNPVCHASMTDGIALFSLESESILQ